MEFFGKRAAAILASGPGSQMDERCQQNRREFV